MSKLGAISLLLLGAIAGCTGGLLPAKQVQVLQDDRFMVFLRKEDAKALGVGLEKEASCRIGAIGTHFLLQVRRTA